jgi:hypothetical protein
LKPAAGRGALMLDESAEHIRFPKMILQSSGIAPQNARLMEASGESIRTTINDGDLMLVDVSPAATEIVEGKIYVFAISDEAYVKRLRRAGGGAVVMISDNREMFPPEEVPKNAPLRIFEPRDVGGKKPERFVAVGCVLLCSAAAARAEESATDVICKALLDSATRVARRGDMAELKRMVPGLEKCQEISEAKLSRQLQELVNQLGQGKAK